MNTMPIKEEPLSLPPSPKTPSSPKETKIGKSLIKAFIALAIIGVILAGIGTAGHFALNGTISEYAFGNIGIIGLFLIGVTAMTFPSLKTLKKDYADLIRERQFAKHRQVILDFDREISGNES